GRARPTGSGPRWGRAGRGTLPRGRARVGRRCAAARERSRPGWRGRGTRRRRRSSVRGGRARTEPALLQRSRAGVARQPVQRRGRSREQRRLLRWRRWRRRRRSRRRRRRAAMRAARLALAIVLVLQGVALAAPAQKSFASLEDAVNALVAAIRAADRKALV